MIFAKQEYLTQLFDAGMPLITSDHLQVRQHIATAWQTAFEKANELSAQACAMLKPRFGECMAAMIDCLFSIDAMSTGTLASFSNSVSSTLEACDGANLRDPLLATCEGLYTKITQFAQSPNLGLNDEQKETFLNHWCGTLQPCLVRLGDQGVTDPVLEHLVALAVSTFRQLGKVTSGGLFILHGLTVTVGDRIAPHMASFMDYVLCALKMTDCDAMGTRVACGLVSDLANSLGDSINPSMPSIVPPLLAVLEDNTFDSEVKLIAIIAFGDICLAAGPRNFQQYLPQTQQSLAQACSLSLGKGATPEEVDLLERLRIALVDAYISILHGLAPDGGSLQASPASE